MKTRRARGKTERGLPLQRHISERLSLAAQRESTVRVSAQKASPLTLTVKSPASTLGIQTWPDVGFFQGKAEASGAQALGHNRQNQAYRRLTAEHLTHVDLQVVAQGDALYVCQVIAVQFIMRSLPLGYDLAYLHGK